MVVSAHDDTLRDLDVVSFGSVPLPARHGDANAFAKAVSSRIRYVRHSHPSALHAVDVSSCTGSDGDGPLLPSHDPTAFGIARNCGAVSSVVVVTVTSKSKSFSDTRFAM